MKRKLILLLFTASLFLLPGCANRYRIRLTNGNEFTTLSKPRLDEVAHVYRYKNANGHDAFIPQLKVSEIAPID